MNKLIIVRGLPGSGKSFLAKQLSEEVAGSVICSADDYFMYQGKYHFSPNHLHQAHRTCFMKAQAAVELFKAPLVIIDNTNTRKKEFKDYLRLAEENQYQIEFKYPQTEWAWDVKECFKKNSHNVPEAVIQKMKDRFEEITPDSLGSR